MDDGGELDWSADQKALVQVVWQSYSTDGKWPLFQYVMRVLQRQRIDAIHLCSQLPSWGGHAHYSLIWSDTPGLVPIASKEIRLTLLGLSLVPEASDRVEDFLSIVRGMAWIQLHEPLDPSTVSETRIARMQLASMGSRDLQAIPEYRTLVEGLLTIEPATWGGTIHDDEETDEPWWFKVPDSVAAFAEVRTLPEYLTAAFGLPPIATPAKPSIEPVLRTDAPGSDGLHRLIDGKVSRLLGDGDHEHAVFVAMKAVEVRVRALAGLDESQIGVKLINRAFGPNGPLLDPVAQPGEQEGTRAIFAGAYAMLRNPVGHRDVDYASASEASDALHTASLLMHILDRVEQRQNALPDPQVG